MKTKLLSPLICAFILSGSSAIAANFDYIGLAADPNDWNDISNWSGGAIPLGAAANALFTGNGIGMTVNQDISANPCGQLQIGRGHNNVMTIDSGGHLANLNQTVVGIAGGKGTLNVSGGTLTTVCLRLGLDVGAASPAGSSVTVSSGNIEVGLNRTSAFTISGGSVSTETDFDFIRGSVSIIGNKGSLGVGGSFDFGTGAGAGPTALNFELNAAGAVSAITADSFTMAGTTSLGDEGRKLVFSIVPEP